MPKCGCPASPSSGWSSVNLLFDNNNNNNSDNINNNNNNGNGNNIILMSPL